ncbi:MAG: hypothetical protein JSS61_06215 [Verrucomicrobia bacterium]|nr:hypothetical protein [Verrucomicrobiota bacterium]
MFTALCTAAALVSLPQEEALSLKSYMLITPQSRAADYLQAFEILRKEKTAGKVFFELRDGSMISNVIEISTLPNSTLLLCRYNSNQGIKFQVIKIEEIATLSYQ